MLARGFAARPGRARHCASSRLPNSPSADRAWVEDFYRTQVRPVLTPLGLDPAHPFPQLLNKSLNGIVQLEIAEEGERRQRLAVVQVPARSAAAGEAAAPRLGAGRITCSWAR